MLVLTSLPETDDTQTTQQFKATGAILTLFKASHSINADIKHIIHNADIIHIIHNADIIHIIHNADIIHIIHDADIIHIIHNGAPPSFVITLNLKKTSVTVLSGLYSRAGFDKSTK